MQRVILGIILLASYCGASYAQDAARGEKVFLKCKGCHQIGEGAKARLGPDLNGIVGRQAGSVDGYAYSDAMKNSQLMWDEKTLAEFLINPKQTMPGTKMSFAGIPKPADIADLIAYLKRFDETGMRRNP